ncbi:MAG: anti-sigma factor family protein [Actinomycetes bacterium]
MSPLSCRAVELSLGAVAMGALEPGERVAVDAHLAVCPRCTATLAEFDEVAGLMNQVTAAEAEAALGGAPFPLARPQTELVMPPETGRPARRSRRLVAAVSLCGAAAAIAGVLVLGPFASDGAPPPRTTHSSVLDPQTHVRASATLQPVEVGTELTLRVSGVPTRQACQLVVVGDDGRRSVAASWLATYAGTARVTGTTSLSPSRIASLVVATPEGRVLATLPVHS